MGETAKTFAQDHKEKRLLNEAFDFLKSGILQNPNNVGKWMEMEDATIRLITFEDNIETLQRYIAEQQPQSSERVRVGRYKGPDINYTQDNNKMQITIPTALYESLLNRLMEDEAAFRSGGSTPSPESLIVNGALPWGLSRDPWGDKFSSDDTRKTIVSQSTLEPVCVEKIKEYCPGFNVGFASINPGGPHNVYSIPEAERLAGIEAIEAQLAKGRT